MTTREAALQSWVEKQLGPDIGPLEPASTDASFRRYFRVATPDGSRIVMDAPPPQEDCRPFVRIAGLLEAANVHVPAILAQDLEQGFLLLSDLGRETYLDVLDAENADGLFSDALDALIAWQAASRPGVLPEYDRALLHRELDLFPEWYLECHLGYSPTPAERRVLARSFALLEDSALAQPQVYVHRDFMPRNLMLSEPNPGVIDFQDAVFGPVSYDPVCLFKDAFISWPQERIDGWLRVYWERAGYAGVPVQSDYAEFRRALDWMGMQRHLKVVGIFARICHRDGKPHYLGDVPRFLGYLREAAAKYREFAPLLEVIEALPSPATGASA